MSKRKSNLGVRVFICLFLNQQNLKICVPWLMEPLLKNNSFHFLKTKKITTRGTFSFHHDNAPNCSIYNYDLLITFVIEMKTKN